MPKSKTINFKVSPAERKALEQLARVEGEQMSVVLRRLIREACIIRGVKVENGSK